MLVFTDLFTGDEVMSDSYAQRPVMDGEAVIPGMFECVSTTVVSGGNNFDIGCRDDEAGADDVEKVNNISSSQAGFGYNQLTIADKEEFKTWMKEYMRKIRQNLKQSGAEQDKIKLFMEEAGIIAKYLISSFNELGFYVGKSYNVDGGYIFSKYNPGESNPIFMFIRWGLREEKF